MKSVKRILSVAVAVLLIAMMMIPAVSAAGSNTVNWTCEYPGYTYTVYTVATYNSTTGAFTATPATLQDAVNNAVDANQMAALAETLTTTTGLTEEGTTFTTNAGSGHFDLNDGIYFIKCTQPGPNNKKVLKNSIVVFPNKNKTTAETINLTDKVNEGQPTVTKEIVGGANTFGTIDTATFKSKTITYKLTADIAGSKDSKLTSYVITDKMGEGLDTSKHDVTSVVLKNGTTETPLTEGTDYTVTTAAADIDCATTVDGGTGTTGNTFGVKLSDTILGTDAFYAEGNQVVVTYETQLKADAAVATDIPNTDAMIYGNESGRNVVPGNTVNVQTYKVEAKKIDAVTKNPLAGAKFGLYQDQACTKLIVESAETGDNGIADFGVKLPAGTYYIKETKVPDGYNFNSAPERVVLPDDTNKTVVIEDTKAKLPSTGGNGTLMFTIIGGSLVLLAAALFVVVMKKKSSAK
jgi:fimbrial isopeptide formation D2 family protein/LPXTG-motif cell wall-anchored protein